MGTPYLTPLGVRARTSADAYTRCFDWSGNDSSATQDANCAVCITDAESEINMCLNGGGAFPGYLNDNGATVDPAILSYEVNLVLFHAVMHNPSAQGEHDAPYFRGYNMAMNVDAKKGPLGFFPRMAFDQLNRAKTGSGGARPYPRAAITNATQSDGVTPTNPYTRVADGVDTSRY